MLLRFLTFNPYLCFFKCKLSTEQQKTINIGFIGRPNSGKSSFINNVVKRHILPVSDIPHTTFKPLKAILTYHDTQYIFHDTPGIMNPTTSKKFYKIPEKIDYIRDTLQNCDLIAVVVDSRLSLKYPFISTELQGILNEFISIPSVLVLSKADKVKGTQLSNLVENLIKPPKEISHNYYRVPLDSGGWDKFDSIFCTDSYKENCVGSLAFINYSSMKATHKPWPYTPDRHYGGLLEDHIEEIARECLFLYTVNEMPFSILPKVEMLPLKEVTLIKLTYGCRSYGPYNLLNQELQTIHNHLTEWLKNELEVEKFRISIDIHQI